MTGKFSLELLHKEPSVAHPARFNCIAIVGDDMVGCDKRACEREWFHLKCLKLQDFPSTKYWYCPDSIKLPQFKRGKKEKN